MVCLPSEAGHPVCTYPNAACMSVLRHAPGLGATPPDQARCVRSNATQNEYAGDYEVPYNLNGARMLPHPCACI